MSRPALAEYLIMLPKPDVLYGIFLAVSTCLDVFTDIHRKHASSCNSFVRYEGACTIIAIEVAALMMLVR